MYISTEIDSFRALGSNERVLRMLKEAGFDAYDYSMFHASLANAEILDHEDYLDRARAFRALADEIGIVCNQAHAPFPTMTDEEHPRLGMTTEAYNAYAHNKITRAIEVAAVLGAKIIVVHPWNYFSAEENAALYRSFEQTARRANIKIGVENMWNSKNGQAPFRALPAACSDEKSFAGHLALLPRDVFVACVDIGHAEMAGLNTSAPQMIESLGECVQALHIHDNDCVRDIHQLPYTGRIDFSAVLQALKKIGYRGDVTLEAAYVATKYPVELYPSVARLMAETAEYMRQFLLK